VVVPVSGATSVSEDSGSVTMTANGTAVTIGKSSGRITRVTRDGGVVSLTNGPALAVGSATLTGFSHRRDGTGHVVQANYRGDLNQMRGVHHGVWTKNYNRTATGATGW
jgi:hypothetical protein